MAKSWFDMAKEGHFYSIDDEGNVVDFGKARGWEVETCYGCEPEVTLRVIPVKVMKNEGASAYIPALAFYAIVWRTYGCNFAKCHRTA